jgi:hypothetical protein
VRIPSRKTPTGWKRPFEDPIPLPGGRRLVTPEDPAPYITELPKAEQLLEWQAAVEALLLVVELNGPTMIARLACFGRSVGMLSGRSLHRESIRIGTPACQH